MNILILYFSKGGNTRKLAQAIAQGVLEVEGTTPVLKKTHEVTREDFLAADGVITWTTTSPLTPNAFPILPMA